MASPFDLYQQKQFEGLDPNLFNQEAFLEQQRGLYAGSLADQLNALRQQYEQQSAFEKQKTEEYNTINNLINEKEEKIKKIDPVLKTAESNYAQAKKKYDDEYNSLLNSKPYSFYYINKPWNTGGKTYEKGFLPTSYFDEKIKDAQTRYPTYVNNEKQILNETRKLLQSKQKKGTIISMSDDQVRSWLSGEGKNTDLAKRWRGANKQITDSLNYIARMRDVKQKITNLEQLKNKQDNVFEKELKPIQKVFNDLSTAVSTEKQLRDNYSSEITTSRENLNNALQKAQTIQTQIQQFKPRERPELQKISGNYEQALQASKDELKQIAESTTDPVTRQYAQVLLNQRASELAGTFGKKPEDVTKELSADIAIPENQLTAQQYRAFMGMPEPTAAPVIPENIPEFSMLPAPGTQLVPVIPEQIAPAPQPAAPAPQPVAPAPQPVKGPEPVIPAKTEAQPGITQQPVLQFNIAQPAEQKTTQMQQPSMPMQQPAAEQQIKQEAVNNQMGMPKQPFGSITPFVQQGLQQQLTKGFEQAMKVRKQPAVQAAPKQRRLGVSEERRKVVAPQVIQKPAQERVIQTSADENSSRQKVLEQSQGKIQG